MLASNLTCTCRTTRATAAVSVAPCAWHRAYRKARRSRLGPEEISRIRRAAWAKRRARGRKVER